MEFNSNNQVFTVDGHDNTRKASFQYGIGAFIGLQAFIADLPLSIGVEYGLSSIFDTRLRYKREYKHGSGDEMVTYTADMSELPNLNSRLADSEISGEGMSAKKGEIGNQFRITITYYFK